MNERVEGTMGRLTEQGGFRITKPMRLLVYDPDGLWDVYRRQASYLPERRDRARALRLRRRAVNLLSHSSLQKGEAWLESCLLFTVGEADGNLVTLEQVMDGILDQYIKPAERKQALIRWQSCANEKLLSNLPIRTTIEWLRLITAPTLDEVVGEISSYQLQRLKQACGLLPGDLRIMTPPDKSKTVVAVVGQGAVGRITDYLRSERQWISLSEVARALLVDPCYVASAVQYLQKMQQIVPGQVRRLAHDGRGTRQIAVEVTSVIEEYLKNKGLLPPELGWERWQKTDLPRGLMSHLRAGEYDEILKQAGLSRAEMVALLRLRRGKKYIDLSDMASGALRRMIEELERERDFLAFQDYNPEGYAKL